MECVLSILLEPLQELDISNTLDSKVEQDLELYLLTITQILEIPIYTIQDTLIHEQCITSYIKANIIDIITTILLFLIDIDYTSLRLSEIILRLIYILLQSTIIPLSTIDNLNDIKKDTITNTLKSYKKHKRFLGSAPIIKKSIIPGNMPRFARNIYEDISEQFNRDTKLLEKVSGINGIIISSTNINNHTIILLQSFLKPIVDFFYDNSKKSTSSSDDTCSIKENDTLILTDVPSPTTTTVSLLS